MLWNRNKQRASHKRGTHSTVILCDARPVWCLLESFKYLTHKIYSTPRAAFVMGYIHAAGETELVTDPFHNRSATTTPKPIYMPIWYSAGSRNHNVRGSIMFRLSLVIVVCALLVGVGGGTLRAHESDNASQSQIRELCWTLAFHMLKIRKELCSIKCQLQKDRHDTGEYGCLHKCLKPLPKTYLSACKDIYRP